MNNHADGDDLGRIGRLITDVLAGDRCRQDTEILALCADPKVARQLDDLIALQARLARAAAAERAALAASPAGADDAQPQLRQPGHVAPAPGAAPAARWRVMALLAAALLLSGAALLHWWPRPAPADVMLHSAVGLSVDPHYAAVRWQHAPGRLWFQVRMRARDGTELERSELLRTESWVPKRADLPDEVIIELWLVDSSAADGRRLAAAMFDRDGRPR